MPVKKIRWGFLIFVTFLIFIILYNLVAFENFDVQQLSDTNAQCYSQNYPDLQNAFGGNLNALSSHWLNNGVGEKRHTSCDKELDQTTVTSISDDQALCYNQNYPDLQTAFGGDIASLISHWNTNGRKEGRHFKCDVPLNLKAVNQLSDGQAQCYNQNYTDLQNSFGGDLNKLKDHWKTYGRSEGRHFECDTRISRKNILQISDAQAKCYNKNYNDLQNAFKGDLNALKTHWKDYGRNEGRTFVCNDLYYYNGFANTK